ncbi:hypothetical protein K0U83_20750, partial [bacterium]|nr:hypothetical protein [bacterium]
MNVLTDPLSGNIYFDSCASQHTSTPDLTGNAVSLGFDGCAGLTVTSYNEDSQDRFTVAGASGSLFNVNDSLVGTVFSVNDAAGLPIIEVNSDATTDTIAIGEYGTNALFVSAGNVGIGTATPTSPLHVCGNIAVTGTVDGRDIVADGTKLDGICPGAGAGTVTSVTAGTGMTQSGSSTVNPTLNVIGGTGITANANDIALTAAGAGAGTYGNTGNACKIDTITLDAYGRVTAVACGATGSGNGSVTSIGITPGSLIDVSGSPVTSSGNITINVDLSELTDGTGAIVPASDEIVYLDAGSQKRKLFSEIFGCNAYSDTAFTTCTGTTTPSNTQTFTNKSGNISQWTNDSGYLTSACSGTVTNVAGCDGITVNNGTGSACVCVNSTVVRTTGNQTIAGTKSFTGSVMCVSGVIKHTGDADTCIAFGTNTIALVTGAECQVSMSTSGVVINEPGNPNDFRVEGDTDTHALFVDGSADKVGIGTANPSKKLHVAGDGLFTSDLTVQGDLTVTGDFTCLETTVSLTSAMDITNTGTGPALVVNQTGSNDIVNFKDDGTSAFYIEDGGFVGLNCTNPVQRLDVGGNVNTSGDYRIDTAIVISSGRCFVGTQVKPTTAITDSYIASAACWNACATSAQGTTANNALPKSGGTMTGSIALGNNNITGVNTFCFADPGPTEGIHWTGGNTKIVESPDNLTTNSAGNLQMVYGSTRRLTVNNTGIDVNGNIVVSGTVDGVDVAALATCPGLNATGTVCNLGNLGITSTAAEINKLDGFTGTCADLNYAKDLRATGVTTTEFNCLDGLTATTTELNYSDGVTSNIQTQLNGKLSTTGCAANAALLDSLDSTAFLRSNAADSLTSVLTIAEGSGGNIVYDLDNNGVYIPKPIGANFSTTTSAHTGAIAIKLPTTSWNRSDMISFHVDIYDYNGGAAGESVSLFIFGYQYSTGNWTNVGAHAVSDRSDRDYTVRFGHDGTRHIVYIGETTSTWNYLQINVRDFQAGFTTEHTYYDSGWDVDVNITSFSNVQQTSSDNYPYAKGLKGMSTTISELNKIDGFTGTVTDLNYAKDLRATGVTTTEFNCLDGLTATTTELNYTDGVTSNIQTQLNAKTSCTGTVTSVATGNGISGGTITGSGTLTVGAGTGLTQTSTGLCINSTCNSTW